MTRDARDGEHEGVDPIQCEYFATGRVAQLSGNH